MDDGSKDNTLARIKEFARDDKQVQYVSFSRNFGKEAAIYAGLKHATGDFVGLMDADLQDPPALLKEMYKAVTEESFDAVGTRRVNRKGEPIIRSFFAKLFYKLINKMTSFEMVDGARDYVFMKRQVVDAILSSDVDIWMFNVGSYIEGANDVAQRTFFEATEWNNHSSDDVIHTFDDCKRPFSRNLAVYNKIYKKSFLDSCGLTFPAGLKYEDQFFILKAFLNAKSIKFTEDVFYRYRNYHETSITCNVSEKALDIFDIVHLV